MNLSPPRLQLGAPYLPSESLFFAPEEHVFAEDWKEMQRIHLPETNLAVLKRPPPSCAGAIWEILASPRGAAQVSLERGADLDLIPALLDEDLDLQAADSLALYQDIRELAERFLEVSQAKKIGVRIERIETDNCRLFHVDHVSLRLVTTYYGKGTEWLKNSHVNRSGLGQGDNNLVGKAGAQIQVIQPGWIGLMKGERGNEGRGLVHRSPPIETDGVERLLLRMDALG